MVFDVFLSYNSHDQRAAIRLARELRRRDLTVWLDVWEMIPGRLWQEALEELIQSTRAAAVLIGSRGFGPWQALETRACLEEFVRRRLPVVPVLLPVAGDNPALPSFLEPLSSIDLRDGWSREGLDRLIRELSAARPTADSDSTKSK